MSDAESTTDVFVLTAKGGRERRKAEDIRGHDFRQSGFLAPSELRRIRLRHEQFIRSLAARLAIFLRLEFSLQLSKVQIGGYQNFIENLPTPTHITLFKNDPLKGVGLLTIPPRLGLTLVDRLLGGVGQTQEENRELSEIETALTDQVASLIISEWCNHWPEMRGLHPSLLGHENNSRYLQTATPDTAMLILTMSGGIGEQSEPIQLVFPYATVEPLVRLLSPALPGSE
jgi:flagellar motor switch protein FliM